jgi:PPOX class probable F420-dependent enzyme
MSAIPDSVRDFLATGPLAHVVTLGRDGTPHVSLAWAGVDGDDVVWATFNPAQYKIQNLRRDPRVTLSFQANEFAGQGLHPYLVVRGRARITDDPALPLMDRLSEAYIGPGQRFPMRDVPAGAVIRVSVEKVYGVGPWRAGADQVEAG